MTTSNNYGKISAVSNEFYLIFLVEDLGKYVWADEKDQLSDELYDTPKLAQEAQTEYWETQLAGEEQDYWETY